MLHNQDEIREFDDKVFELHSLLASASEAEKVSAIGDVMRILVSHDWPEWAPGHQWCVHPDCFEAFDTDDLEYLKRLVAGVVTVLSSNGSRGVPNLQKYATAYLQQRGHRVVTQIKPSSSYSVSGLAKIIGARDNETARNYLTAARLPIATGQGKRMSYTHSQAEQFARQVVANPSQNVHSIAAERWLEQQRSKP